MIETLGTTLVVVFCVLIFLAQAAGIASFIMNIVHGNRLRRLTAELAAEKALLAVEKDERERAAVAAKAELDKARAEIDNERLAAVNKAELDKGRAELDRE